MTRSTGAEPYSGLRMRQRASGPIIALCEGHQNALMSAKPEQIHHTLEAYVKAWATGDRALFLSLFAEDAEWSDPVGKPEFKGHRGIAQAWDVAHHGRILQTRLEEIRGIENQGAVHFTVRVRNVNSNESRELSVIHYVWLNEAGKIQIARAAWDKSAASKPNGID